MTNEIKTERKDPIAELALTIVGAIEQVSKEAFANDRAIFDLVSLMVKDIITLEKRIKKLEDTIAFMTYDPDSEDHLR